MPSIFDGAADGPAHVQPLCRHPIDAETVPDDLVLWLHRPPDAKMEGARPEACWTGELRHISSQISDWITTQRVLAALSPGGAGRSAYIRRKTQPSLRKSCILTGRTPRRARRALDDVLGQANHHAPGGSRTDRTSKRSLSSSPIHAPLIRRHAFRLPSARSARRKVVAAVLCTERRIRSSRGRLFGRSRYTLIEQAERYRDFRPQLFRSCRTGTRYVSGERTHTGVSRRRDRGRVALGKRWIGAFFDICCDSALLQHQGIQTVDRTSHQFARKLRHIRVDGPLTECGLRFHRESPNFQAPIRPGTGCLFIFNGFVQPLGTGTP